MADAQRQTPPRRSPLTRLIRWLQLKNYQYEVTFSLYMLTKTEKIVFNTILITLVSLLLTAAYYYLPNHLYTIYNRATYYISGDFTSNQTVDPTRLAASLGSGVDSLLKTTKEVIVSQTASALARDATTTVGEAAEILKDEL